MKKEAQDKLTQWSLPDGAEDEVIARKDDPLSYYKANEDPTDPGMALFEASFRGNSLTTVEAILGGNFNSEVLTEAANEHLAKKTVETARKVFSTMKVNASAKKLSDLYSRDIMTVFAYALTKLPKEFNSIKIKEVSASKVDQFGEILDGSVRYIVSFRHTTKSNKTVDLSATFVAGILNGVPIIPTEAYIENHGTKISLDNENSNKIASELFKKAKGE